MARSARDGVVVRDAPAGVAWNDLVGRAPGATVLHREEALETVAAHSGATLHRLVGFEADAPVGVFPAFTLAKGPVSAVFSPPPGMGLPALGPALLGREDGGTGTGGSNARGARFADACWRWLRERVEPSYVNVVAADGFADLRRFARDDGYRVVPQFTYVVDLARDERALLDSFSSDARNNVRRAREAPVVVREGGREAIEAVVDQLRARYDEQGLSYPVAAGFVADLYERLPDGAVRPYACTVDGEFVGGMVALADDRTVSRWQGGAKTDADLPVNDYLDWRVMCDAAARGQVRYDLVGANTPGLCQYKAKFNPELVTYFRVEGGTRGMGLVAGVYRRLRKLGFAPKNGE